MKIYVVRIEETTGIGLTVEEIIAAYKTRDKAAKSVEEIASKLEKYDKVWIEEIDVED